MKEDSQLDKRCQRQEEYVGVRKCVEHSSECNEMSRKEKGIPREKESTRETNNAIQVKKNRES